jgi:hypothetical protein
MDKSKSSIFSNSTSGPTEMKHHDKIPRTPIDPELLAQIHRESVSIIYLILVLLFIVGTPEKL